MIYLTPTKIPKEWQAGGEARSILRKNPIEQCFCKTNVLAAKLVHLKSCA